MSVEQRSSTGQQEDGGRVPEVRGNHREAIPAIRGADSLEWLEGCSFEIAE